MKRVLVLNPNSSTKVTEHLRSFLETIKSADTQLKVVNIQEGPTSIESHYDIALAVPEIIKIVSEMYEEFDSVFLACFADPGLEVLREILDKPVIGAMESSIYVACMLGERFSIIAINQERAKAKWRYVRSLGLEERMVSVEAIDMSVLEMEENPSKTIKKAVEAAMIAKSKGADVVILGCASMAGYSKIIQEKAEVCVIDPIMIGYRLTEALTGMNLMPKSKKLKFLSTK